MAQYTAFYLYPRSGYRTTLRSDTLWSTLVWAYWQLYGDSKLSEWLSAYEEDESEAFYVSSVFPCLLDEGLKPTVHYLPPPLTTAGATGFQTYPSFAKAKEDMRRKKKQKDLGLVSMPHWRHLIGGEPAESLDASLFARPERVTAMSTHVTIDRLGSSTLSIGESGQLYHSRELGWRSPNGSGQRVGLYFLAGGNTDLVETLLRTLRHLGIGADRTTGKGTFQLLDKDSAFKVPTPTGKSPNALMTLSLYRPTPGQLEQLEAVSGPDRRYLNYRILRRQGRLSPESMQDGRFMKDSIPYFVEGSTFPISALGDVSFAGENPPALSKSEHPARQYGQGFFIPIHIK